MSKYGDELLKANIDLGSIKSRHQTYYVGDKPIHERGISKIRKYALMTALSAVIAGSFFSGAITDRLLGDKFQSPVIQVQQIKAPLLEYSGNQDDIVKKLVVEKETFLALVITMEKLETKPYIDAVGKMTIGAGYCIPEQIKMLGIEGVKGQLRQSSISEDNIRLLLSKSPAEQKKAEITQGQAIKLLSLTAPIYMEQARQWLTDVVFDNLDKAQQETVAYLFYNVGALNMPGFKKLHAAILSGDHTKVVKNIAPWFKDEHNKWHKNERVGQILGAKYTGNIKNVSPVYQAEVQLLFAPS